MFMAVPSSNVPVPIQPAPYIPPTPTATPLPTDPAFDDLFQEALATIKPSRFQRFSTTPMLALLYLLEKNGLISAEMSRKLFNSGFSPQQRGTLSFNDMKNLTDTNPTLINNLPFSDSGLFTSNSPTYLYTSGPSGFSEASDES
jgi:hypothetical protein